MPSTMSGDNNSSARSETQSRSLSGTRRERSDDEDEEPRRVLQRTDQGPLDETTGMTQAKTMTDILTNDLWSDDEAALEEAMVKLQDTIYYKEEWDEFFQLGGPAAVVRVMHEHPDCKALQVLGLTIFQVAAKGDTTIFEYPMRETIAKIKGIHVVLAAMSRFRLDAEIQVQALRALECLCSLPSNAVHLITDHNGAEMIVGVMKRFPDHEGVLKESCRRILKSLTSRNELRPAIFDAKASSALAAAIESHVSSADRLHNDGRKALYYLMKRD